MPDFFISFQVFPDWVNKFRTLREKFLAGLSKLNSACAEKHCRSQKNVNVIIRNGQNPENKVYILRQWFFS